MGYFDTTKGSDTMEIIARSLVRIANALEEQNRLLMEASGTDGRRMAQCQPRPKETGKEIAMNEIV